MSHEADYAWAAGLFEGEGCFSIMQSKPRKSDGLRRKAVIVALSSTDLDVLQKFHAILECGGITKKKRGADHHKQQWVWQSTRHADFLVLLEKLMPHLCERRRNRALEVLQEYQEQPVRRVSKTHCPHGHEFTPENTFLSKQGWRKCVECRRAACRRSYAKKKALA